MEVIKEKRKGFANFREIEYYRYKLISDDEKVLCSIDADVETIEDKTKYINEYKDKKVIYLNTFSTTDGNRNKGYGRYLLNDVIRRFKGKYDLIHLNACPYHHPSPFWTIYKAPKDGLKTKRLVEFYKTFGFKKLRTKYCDGHSEVVMVLM